jgi:S-adenosylmethionine hydrolase
MQNPLITLTTDFGTADHFVGSMKGVIAGIAPRARVIDITHEVSPFEIVEGAFTIAEAWRAFPQRTIHVVVVDPGVGSARRPILAEVDGHYFVSPDNGVLSLVWGKERGKVRHITATRYFRVPVSETFHGRDIFSPVAAHLAAGVAASKFGKLIHDAMRLSGLEPVRTGKRAWTGVVLKVDRFGNLITNFHIDEFEAIRTQPFTLLAGMERLSRLAANFSEGAMGELLVIVGSSGYLEIAVNRDSAAKRLGCGSGAPLELTIY